MRIFLFFVMLVSTISCRAEVFKSIDEQGNVTYSDTPLNSHAEKIELPQESTDQDSQSLLEKNSTVQDANNAISDADTEKAVIGKEKKPYQQFTIAYPANGETIQNQPVITVEIKVDPALQEGDKIQIYLDGTPWGEPQANTNFQFTRPERGAHQLSAKLIDDKRSVLKESGPYTIYIHQAHIPNPPVRPS